VVSYAKFVVSIVHEPQVLYLPLRHFTLQCFYHKNDSLF